MDEETKRKLTGIDDQILSHFANPWYTLLAKAIFQINDKLERLDKDFDHHLEHDKHG